MSETMQAIRTAKNKAEPIINHTPAEPFKSPLQIYVMNNCEHCDFYKARCRLEDSRGLTPMSLCISLYTHQVPVDFGEILRQAQEQNPEAARLKEINRLTEIQEAETRDDA